MDILRLAVLAFVCALAPTQVVAQVGLPTAAVAGVVKDKDGTLPGASVVMKRVATGETIGPVVTNENGGYSFSGLAPGPYTLTIFMNNYHTVEVAVELVAGQTQSVRSALEVGKREEIVSVDGGGGAYSLVRTETATVSQTASAYAIQTLPRNDRNALSYLIFLPSVTTIGGASSARGATTIAGLPADQFNITIDGITTSSLLNNQGLFSMVTPRLDATEEMTLTTASPGADAAGQGAIQVRFVTRSGTNKFETSLYEFMQHAALNSNTYFNRLNGLPVPAATSHTFGGRVGGPVMLPHFDGRGRAFFFVNHEEVYSPIEVARTRTIIRPAALDGNFCYGVTGAPTCVNVLALAAANGQIAAYDPTVKALLESIRSAASTTGTMSALVASPNTAGYDYLAPETAVRHAPTMNVTWNLTPKNRIQTSYYWESARNTPDTANGADAQFPGFPVFGIQTSHRTTASIALRSTLSTAIVNEVRGGWHWSPINYFTNATAAMFENQDGFNLALGFGLTSPAPAIVHSPQKSLTPNYTISDQLNYLKGSHSLQFGGDYTRVKNDQTDYTVVPSLAMGYQTNFDPAEPMFAAANFPGSSSSDRNNARALYALLTGRVSSISGTGVLAEDASRYVYNGPITNRETQDDYSFYAQDVWRITPTLTATLGVRYQYTLPMKPASSLFTTMSAEDSCGISGIGQGASADGSTDRFCNMFQPGHMPNPTDVPTYVPYTTKNKGYNTDFNNLGPVIGLAWRPNVQDGYFRALLGDPELATLNGGYTRSFVRTQLTNFLTVYNGNPGQTIPATRSTSANAFPIVLPGETWPILFSQKGRLGPPAFNDTPQFPITASFESGEWIFNPNIQLPWTDSWNVSFQREVARDMVFEIRYQGNKGYKAWTLENWNATNVYETGWLDGEFEKAQANLRANVLAGLGGTFRYTGIPGTSPLPITLAHFNARTDASNASPTPDTGAYQGNIWTNATFVSELDPLFPDPYGFAGNLYLSSSTSVASGVSSRFFSNATNVGYPANYWQMNPSLNAVNVETNSANHPLNHLVMLQMRRRLSAGLMVEASYVWQRNTSGDRLDFHLPLLYMRSNGVPHAIQTVWMYDLPMGRSRKYGADLPPWLDGIVSGWTISGTARFQRQSFNIRNAVLVGISMKDARAALGVIRFVTDPVSGAVSVFNFPEDIYTNTRLAYSTDPTQPGDYAPGTEPNGPAAILAPDGVTYRYFAPAGGDGCNFVYAGDCGAANLYFLGRWFGELDFRLAKQFELPGRGRFEFSVEVFNATKALNFPNVINPSSSADAFRTTSTQSAGRTGQLVWRVSW